MRKWNAPGLVRLGTIAAVMLFAGAARAQAPLIEGETPLASEFQVTDPAIIGRCLCAGGRVSADKDALDVTGRHYAAVKAHAEATGAAVMHLRSQVRPDNAEQLDAFRRLVVENQQAERELYGNAQPAYAAAVSRYNQSVTGYNAGCAGLRVDKTIRARVAQSLVCPAP